MKNRTPDLNQRGQVRNMDWLSHEAQEDDFLLGKTPSELHDIWEDEE